MEIKPLPPVVHTLEAFDATIGFAPVGRGETLPMLRCIFKVNRQDPQGRHPTETWPDLWLEPHTVVALSESLHTALWRHMPEEARKMGLPEPQAAPAGVRQ